MNKLDYLGCDIYTIETDEATGEKRVHIMGYFYDCEDNVDDHYRLTEFTFCYVPIQIFQGDFWDYLDEAQASCKQYIGDLTEEEMNEQYKNFFGGAEITPLPYSEITQ